MSLLDRSGGRRIAEDKIAAMFESFRKLITELGEGGKTPDSYEENDYRLAAAALLVHAAGIDGAVSKVEQDKLHAIIKQRFNLDDEAADTLVAEATQAEHEAIDLYQFTARLNRSLDHAGRARIVEMMWQIVCADEVITEFEDNLVWRAADLLGISRNERIALRQRVLGSNGSGTKQ
jgi:uncharacterized tellurite resistance protein B-like protein